jgi:hypothetical protein
MRPVRELEGMIRAMKVGVVSDTHGLLRPRVTELLAGCDAILHAGDVGAPEVLEALRRVAPLTAVRGNVDTAGELARLPDRVSGVLGDGETAVRYRMVHRGDDVEVGWSDGHGLVVFGHSHRPELAWRGSCLLLNPGACGPRRFRLPLTLALLEVRDGRIVPELRAVE